MNKIHGTVYLVGAGPGNPGLMTVRGRELLEMAEVVFYDHLVNPELLNLCPNAEFHYVGKIGHGASIDQESIEKQLIAAAQKFSKVVRLKGGDPYVFGRGAEEAQALAAAGIPFEVVPGITSVVSVPAYAGIPLTHRALASSFTVVTGHEDPQKQETDHSGIPWPSLAQQPVIVFLMGVKTIAKNFQKLLEHGLDPLTPAALISWGTYAQQKTLVGTLSSLPKQAETMKVNAPAVIVIGEVVNLHELLGWFERRPLFGRRIIVTRSRSQASQLAAPLRELGAEVLELPCISFVEAADQTAVEIVLQTLDRFDWIALTSSNAVDFFFAALKRFSVDVRKLSNHRFGVIGKTTAQRLQSYGVFPDLQAEQATGESLAQSFAQKGVAPQRVLLPRVKQGSSEILENFTRQGIPYQELILYERIIPKRLHEQKNWIIDPLPDLVTLMSSETVRHYWTLLDSDSELEVLKKVPVAVIGPKTKEIAQSLGLKVIAMAKTSTVSELVNAIVKVF